MVFFDEDASNNLTDLCARNQVSLLQERLKRKGEEKNVLEERSGLAPLHVAVCDNNVKCIELLLDCKDLDVNIQDRDGNTAIMRYLIQTHPRVNKQSSRRRFKYEVVQMLLSDDRIDLNVQNSVYRQTCLMLSLDVCQDLKLFRMLVTYNPILTQRTNINVVDIHGKTCLHYLCTMMMPTRWEEVSEKKRRRRRRRRRRNNTTLPLLEEELDYSRQQLQPPQQQLEQKKEMKFIRGRIKSFHHHFHTEDSRGEMLELIAFMLKSNTFQEDVNLNLQDVVQGHTVLHDAIMSGKLTLVESLTSKTNLQIDPNLVDKHHLNSYIHMAVLNQDVDMLCLLLSLELTGKFVTHKHNIIKWKDQNLNLLNRDGYAPLHLCILLDSLEMFNIFFLKESSRIQWNLRDQSKLLNTPLSLACSLPYGIKFVDRLLSLRTGTGTTQSNEQEDQDVLDVNARNVQGNTCLHVAILRDDVKLVKLLLQQQDSSFLDVNILQGENHMEKNLLEIDLEQICHYSSSNHQQSGKGGVMKRRKHSRKSRSGLPIGLNSPLQLAVLRKQRECVQLLLQDSRLDVNQRNSPNKQTVLHLICSTMALMDSYSFRSSLTYLEMILNSKLIQIDINAQDELDRNTVLHLCALHQLEPIFKLFLSYGFREKLNFKLLNRERRSCLHVACQTGNNQMVEDILKQILSQDGEDLLLDLLKTKDNLGQTPLHVACMEPNFKMVQLLTTITHNNNTKNPAKGTKSLKVAPNGVKHFLNLEDSNRNTALHHACFTNCLPIIEHLLLLDPQHIQVSTQNLFGETPLHILCFTNNLKGLERILLHPKLDPNVQNFVDGNTCLHMACEMEHWQFLYLVYLQWNKRIDLRKQNFRGETALHVAVRKNKVKGVETLLTLHHTTSNIVEVKDGMGRTCLELCRHQRMQLKQAKRTQVSAQQKTKWKIQQYTHIHQQLKRNKAIEGLLIELENY